MVQVEKALVEMTARFSQICRRDERYIREVVTQNGNSAAGANLNRDSVTRGSATEIASNFVLSPRRRNVHRVRRSFVLRLLWCSEGHQSNAWRIHMTANILVQQFLSTAAFCFQAIQFEGLCCFQSKGRFVFRPEANVHEV